MADMIAGSAHVDPDAQATVTDFIDYTEHLPSDIRRSLALIEKLNELIYSCHDKVHTLAKQWSNRVEAAEGENAEKVASDLRAQISHQKELSRKYAWASLAEAKRLDQEIARHQNLIKITGLKLDALPLPPSRDPSPRPLSPQASRATEGHTGGGPKITLKLDKARALSQAGRSSGPPRPRQRRMVVVPGEVLPPPNLNSPTDSGFSEWESLSPIPSPGPKKTGRKPLKSHKAVPREEKSHKKKKERAPRDPNRPGTNVHSAVAGISTSNALMMLTPPPVNPIPGTRWAPWTRLTEYEMAKLRKRMKKNAVWTPSDTMIRRELNDAGRGPENYLKAKQRSEETGEELVDIDDLANRGPDELKPGEIPLGSKSKLTNKGMSLNVQKKNKKLLLAREMAMELAKEADKAAKQHKHAKGLTGDEATRAKEAARIRAETVESKLSLLGPQFRDLFTRPGGSESPETDRIVLKTPGRKRKRESDQPRSEESQLYSQLHSEIIVTPSPSSNSKHLSKKRKHDDSPLTRITTTTSKVPLAAAASSPIKTSRGQKPVPRRLSLVIKPPAPPSRRSSRTSTPTINQIASRHSPRTASGRQSAEPSGRDRARRQSTTPATPTAVTLATSRHKRPAPGLKLSPATGNAIIVGKRPKKPGKKGGARRDDMSENNADPNEPHYCICNDVSWGTMVMCENPNCDKEWFHLECVGLTEIPGRRTKWWCPDCAKQMGKKK